MRLEIFNIEALLVIYQQGKAAKDYPGGLSILKTSLSGWQKRISVL
jgi:hypothetical protein